MDLTTRDHGVVASRSSALTGEGNCITPATDRLVIVGFRSGHPDQRNPSGPAQQLHGNHDEVLVTGVFDRVQLSWAGPHNARVVISTAAKA